MAKVLLLGSTGKLGRRVLAQLIQDNNYEIGVLIRVIPELEMFREKGIKHFKGDITERLSLDPSFDWADIIINCTGYVSYKRNDWEKLNLINVQGVKNIVNACLKFNKKLIHTSSTSIYGCTNQPIPFQEGMSYDNVYRSKYAESKIEAERIVLASPIKKIILRPSSLISEERSTVKSFYKIYKKGFYAGLKGGGSFALMDDAAKAYITALYLIQTEISNKEIIFNLGGHNLTCAEVYNTFKRIIPRKTQYLSSSLLRYLSILNDFFLFPVFKFSIITVENYNNGSNYSFVDSSKAHKILSYKLTPFEESLKEIL